MGGDQLRDEEGRLRSLRKYRVLDTPAEPMFEAVVELARQIFDVPMAVISFLDEKRQWFKARCGLDAEETPRSHAFCAYTIQGNDIFHVLDAREDERFRDNPLVTGAPDIRFYAGAPLRTSEGYNLGSIAVLDTKPRELSDRERVLLKT